MKTSRRPPLPRWAFVVLTVIVALGFALRAWHLGAESLWLDEAHSILQAKAWWKTIWVLSTLVEPNPPLYFTLLKFWLHAFGDSEAAARSMSVLFGTLTIVMVFIFARRAGGTRLALAAAGIAATSPMLVIYSRDTRGYALVILAATVSLIGVLRLLSRLRARREHALPSPPDRLTWAAYVGGAAVAIYTHTTLLLLPVIANIVAVAIWASAPRRDWQFARRWGLANAAILLIYLPWIRNVLGGSVAKGTFWIEPISFEAALGIVRIMYGEAYVPLQPLPDLAIAAFALAGLVVLRRSPAALALVLGTLILVPLLTYLVSLSHPILIPRVLLWPLPFLAVAVAAGALAIPNRALAATAVVLIMVGQMIGLTHSQATIKHEPWREIVAHFHRERQPGDVLVLAPSYFAMPFEYYAGRDDDVLTVELWAVARPNSHWSYQVIGADEFLARVAGRRRVWLVTDSMQFLPLTDPLVAQIAPAYSLVEDTRMDGLKLRLFAQRP
jgi:uncharacterized membrane protein